MKKATTIDGGQEMDGGGGRSDEENVRKYDKFTCGSKLLMPGLSYSFTLFVPSVLWHRVF